MDKVLAFLTLLLLAIDMEAVNPLSAASKLALARNAVRAGQAAPRGDLQDYRAFIQVDGIEAVNALRRHGVQVNAVLDGYVVATIPAGALPSVVMLAGVRHISIGQPLQLCNDTARFLSRVDAVHAANGRIAPLTGKGVIIGMIDSGIDFNHINLCDNEGRTRVRAVYMPEDSTGAAPIVRGDTLPGSCYETAEQIARLATDFAGTSHGTHTTGTAAGSWRGNGWHGVAPEADIVACGIPSDQLTDVNIANALIYIFDYADRAGLPCVINLSIGSNGGPNDGSSFLCHTFESLTGPGRICVVSSGNDGAAPVCLHASIKGRGDTLTTLLRNQWGGLERHGVVSAWSDASQHHLTRLVVINRASGAMEYASPFLDLLSEDSVLTISSADDLDFAQYYDGEIKFANAMEPLWGSGGNILPDGRYHSFWDLDVTSVRAGHLIGVQYVCDEPVDIAAWCTRECYFYTFGLDGMTGGQSSGSISDMATTDSVISVGAYCSRTSYIDKAGNAVNFSNSHPCEIADFSAYGPDERGVMRPDVCAPGLALLSSANRYDTVADRRRWPAPVLAPDGQQYPYYSNQGTSMSAPVVAGTVALMLQVNDKLGPAAVREILRRTSVVDGDVLAGNPERWGFGKLDAAAAVDDVIGNTLLAGDVNDDGEVNVADVLTLIDIILGDKSGHEAAMLIRADVDRDSEVLLADVNRVIDLILTHF